MNKWMEVFRAGRNTSASGQTREWTESDLEKIVTSYDPDKHEAPIVVGHPKDNSPAYGWIEQLKAVGRTLLAKPKQVEPQFAEMVRSGRFKKRSISLYPDGSLRHVGFLGAQPPAIKGLKDVSFSDKQQDFETYEYTEDTMTEVEKLQAQLDAEKQARQAAEQKAADFKEKAKTAEENFAEAEKKARRAEVDNFIESGIKDGKILPAWKEAGLGDFMLALDDQTQTYEFAEGTSETPGAWFRKFISDFAEHPLFKEMAKPDGDKDRQEADSFAEDERIADEIAGPYKAGD